MPGDRERVVMASPTRHNKPGARLAGSAQPAAVAATPKQIAGLRTPQRPQNSRHAGKVQVQDDPQASLSARWFVPTAATEPRGNPPSWRPPRVQIRADLFGRRPRASQNLTAPYRAFDQQYVPIAVKAA